MSHNKVTSASASQDQSTLWETNDAPSSELSKNHVRTTLKARMRTVFAREMAKRSIIESDFWKAIHTCRPPSEIHHSLKEMIDAATEGLLAKPDNDGNLELSDKPYSAYLKTTDDRCDALQKAFTNTLNAVLRTHGVPTHENLTAGVISETFTIKVIEERPYLPNAKAMNSARLPCGRARSKGQSIMYLCSRGISVVFSKCGHHLHTEKNSDCKMLGKPYFSETIPATPSTAVVSPEAGHRLSECRTTYRESLSRGESVQ